jgi:tRNA-specific 2-thiouridylase
MLALLAGGKTGAGEGAMAVRVVLAMSGGVDSSVAAYLLKERGYEVIGLFMRTGSPSPDHAAGGAGYKKGCCSILDASDARRVADRLDIPFYVLNFQADFERLINYFVDEYLSGRTPNPCVLCNTWLKFGKLWSFGKQLDADFLATGHYARIVQPNGTPELHRAIDAAKDQSYVLFGLSKDLLPHLLFPIGNLRKEKVRHLAREAGLAIHDKRDSVEICFVPEGDHAVLVRERRTESARVGPIVDTGGRVLGQHHGIERFTIGQRKGLGVAAGERLYVVQILPGTNTVVLGQRQELLAAGLKATRVNWLLETPPAEPFSCQGKIRYRHTAAPATVTPLANGEVKVSFAQPQSAVTPGQAVVFYDGSRVLGGGWIEESLC